MEVGEQPTLRLMNKVLHTRRNAEPLEFARHKFVARHHRSNVLHPIGTRQRAASGLLRFEPASIASSNSVKWLYISDDAGTHLDGSSLAL